MIASLPQRLYLWERRTLYLGPLRSPAQLSLAASRLLIGLQGNIRFRHRTQQRDSFSRSLLLPVGWQGTVDSGRLCVADCHLDVTGFDYAVLRQLANRQDQSAYCDLSNEHLLITAFDAVSQRLTLPEVLYQQLDAWLNPAELAEGTAFRCDQRILNTLQRIKVSPLENLSVASLAQQVGLSTSRLANLFKEQIGVPIRRYRLWYRLFLSTQRIACGASVTEAALGAGFADAAHFTRTYRTILGIQPSALVKPRAGLEVFVEAQASAKTVNSFKP
ncbi:helix-turn-helix domain-containing protein [Pseudomonas sp. XK-1]|uniref:helix-turn-helix domain-containing protein n=1 Tax=Pseudomonas sp. XK-1 TaxID=3136019 RepID=UPI003119404A